jgi:hypothetical protein
MTRVMEFLIIVFLIVVSAIIVYMATKSKGKE